MQKKVIKFYLEIIIALFFIIISLIEFWRPISSFPYVENQDWWNEIAIYNDDNIWAKFGFFGGQFAYFTNWTNWLFIGTIFYGWILHKKVNCYWKNALSVYLFITTVIFFAGISPFLIWGESSWIDYMSIHEHLLVTICWIMFLFMTKNQKIKSFIKSIIVTLTVPVIYFLFSLIIYLLYQKKVAIYPFLNYINIFNLGLKPAVSITISIFVLLFIIVGIITGNYLFFELNDYQSTHKKRVQYFNEKKRKKPVVRDY